MTLQMPMQNPHIIIEKRIRLLQIFDGEKLIKEYRIALGFDAVGDKTCEGDGKTPEGEFYIYAKNNQSKFYLSLALSYPNRQAAERGLKENIVSTEEYNAIIEAVEKKQKPPQKTQLGGEIYVHGGGTKTDWTRGCVALENEAIKEIFEAIPIGAKVRILP